MAVEVIPNQPLSLIVDGETFNERNARLMWDSREFCQLVKTTQTQQFQLRVTEDSGNNLIANGDFTTNINGWVVIPNGAVQVNPPVTHVPQGRAVFVPINAPIGGSLAQQLTLEAKTYKLSFDVRWNSIQDEVQRINYSIGQVIGSTEQIGGDSNVQTGTSGVRTYVSYWRIINPAVFIQLLFNFTTTTSSHDFAQSIDNVRLVEMTEPVLILQDCNGNYIKDINVAERFEDIITYTHSWTDQSDGQCYQFCLLGTDDLSLDYLDAFCLVDGRGSPIVDENGECLEQEIV